MKNRLAKITLATLLTASALAADSSDYRFHTSSLIGFEGGYSSMDVERNNGITAATTQNHKFSHGGIKIGAQTEEYRLFLSGRYYVIDGFDYVSTMGAEFQYMINFSSAANIFLGVNTGLASMKFTPTGETTSRTVSDPYVGADAGLNIHLGESVDFELGARVLNLQAENTKNSIVYKFDNLISAYASIIFKYQID
ncbi:hypothetical protein KJ877_10805 [bacterium]|nr:hypothetical protein [bacterium]MBU1990981.1 hypothetical protein [bacterium]